MNIGMDKKNESSHILLFVDMDVHWQLKHIMSSFRTLNSTVPIKGHGIRYFIFEQVATLSFHFELAIAILNSS